MRRSSRSALALAASLVLTGPSCIEDVLLSASNLEITPSPAQAGQSVTFTFVLTVIPAQGFTVIVLIDGAEHIRLTRSEAWNGPFVIDLGDAAALITRYGLGAHVGAIEVRLHDSNRTTGTAGREFELQQASP